jgi:dihydroneopterin aldolase
VSTRIGVYDWERTQDQTLRLDIEIGVASAAPFESDDLADATDYSVVVGRLRALAAGHSHHLLERFAQAIADLILVEFRARRVRVRVAKLAPIPGVRELGVEIERESGTPTRRSPDDR